MSAGPDPRSNAQVIEQERRKLSQRLDEVARLCEGTLPPNQFYGEMLQRVIESLAAVAGSVWVRTPQGNLQQQFQINMQQVGLDGEDARAPHDMLLRFAFTNPQQWHLPPKSSIGPPQDGRPAPGNPTQYLLLLVPIKQNEDIVGLIEVFQGANRPAAAIPGFLQYIALMADLAGRYQRNQLVGQLTNQQQLWGQLEAFARSIHSSLNPIEVSYHVASEGRRLIECDRISVANRRGGTKTQIEAVSGCDTIEKRSNQIRLMRTLADAVLDWGERLVYSGGPRDDSLPPRVGDALDKYLEETPSKLLVVHPLADERDLETDKQKLKEKPPKPARSVLIMECFETPEDMHQTMARLDVVSRHASSALHNAIEHHRIPMRWVWMPIAKLQEGLGGKTKAITLAVVAALSVLVTGLIVVPYPLKVEATGNALPVVRRYLFSPVEGQIRHYDVRATDEFGPDRALVQLYDSNLSSKTAVLKKERDAADLEATLLEGQAKQENNPAEQSAKRGRAKLKELERKFKDDELAELLKRTHADKNVDGRFYILAPRMTPEERAKVDREKWTVLNSNFQEQMPLDRTVRPNEPILRVGAKDGEWELELKIPQKHIGQVLRGYAKLKAARKAESARLEEEAKSASDEQREKLRLRQKHLASLPLALDVDFIMLGDATTKYKGKLHYERIAGEATPDTEVVAGQEPEPVVLSYVRIEPINGDIDPAYVVPRERLLTGSGVKAKIVCADYAAGYSLFYGVWEFLYEKVVFYVF